MTAIDGFVIKPSLEARAAYICTDPFAQQAVAELLFVAFGGRWPRMN